MRLRLPYAMAFLLTMVVVAFAMCYSPGLSKEAAMRGSSLSSAKQLATALELYADDNGGRLPNVRDSAEAWKLSIQYTNSHGYELKTLNPNGGQLEFNLNLSGIALKSVRSVEDLPLITETRAWPDGKRIVVFADGHGRYVREEDWSQIEAALSRKP